MLREMLLGKYGRKTALVSETEMLNLNLGGSRPLKILCLGAHCDDIEIGCGGTVLSLLEGEREVDCTWVTFCSNKAREEEARKSAEVFLAAAVHKMIMIHDFRDGYLPYLGDKVKDTFEKLKKAVDPDVIFTHYGNDKHQDHRLVSELTLNTYRNHLILEYEIPKYDGDLGTPNAFFEIAEKLCNLKIDTILNIYDSQKQKNWFTEDLFWSLLRIRGMEINSESKYAEAFYSRKLLFTHRKST